jgi:DNA-binding CsgD family transcriptional regulator
MIIFSFTILLSLYLFFGIYILVLNPRNKLNILFFIISLTFSLECFIAIILQTDIVISHHPENCVFWSNCGIIVSNFIFYFMMIFYILYTRLFKLKPSVIILLLVFPLILSIRHLFVNEPATCAIIDNVHYYKHFGRDVKVFMIYQNIYFLLMITLVLIRLYKTTSKRVRKQLRIILFSQIASILLLELDHYFLFVFTNPFHYRIPGEYLLYMLIWVAGILYSMVRYRFLASSPELFSQDILSNIDELVILLDTDFNIVHMNNKAIEIIGSGDTYTGENFRVIIKENEALTKEMNSLYEDVHTDFSCRLNLIRSGGETVCIDTKFKTIKDKYRDIVGMLIIAKPVKELAQFQELYNITGRECNVIQLAINGKTNHEIADELNISERTVKTHLTHIFNKLGVDNKIQLMMLLKEFNLIPEISSEMTLLPGQE